MIAADMRDYSYSVLTEKENAYGQPIPQEQAGKIKMAVYLKSQMLNENALYSKAEFIGLTLDKAIDDKYTIKYGNDELKVLYVTPQGRYKQVFMARKLLCQI